MEHWFRQKPRFSEHEGNNGQEVDPSANKRSSLALMIEVDQN